MPFLLEQTNPHSHDLARFVLRAINSTQSLEMIKILVSFEKEEQFHSSEALLSAVRCGNVEIVRFLCDSFLRKAGLFKECMRTCAGMGHLDVFKYLWNIEKKFNCFEEVNSLLVFLACANGRMEILRFLVEKCGGKLNYLDTMQENCLMAATKVSSLEIVKFLLLDKSPTLLNHANKNGKTCLFIACSYGYLEIAKFLIEEIKCDLEIRDNEKSTVLHEACFKGHLKIVKCLVKNGAKVNAVNNDGESPLFLATCANRTEIIQFLIENGADVNIKSNFVQSDELLSLFD